MNSLDEARLGPAHAGRLDGRPMAQPAPAPSAVAVDVAGFVASRLPDMGGGAAGAAAEAVLQSTLYGPLLEFLGRPGKGVRARLVHCAWRLCGGAGPVPETLAVLPELLHGASLIVDDIQDGAETRRGAPALHRLIGVGAALNAANWLYFWPQALIEELPLSPARRRRCTQLITTTLLDCHRGQALDLGAPVWEQPREQVPGLVAELTRLKTGRLTALCMGLGAVAAGARPAQVRALLGFGEQAGVALQMLDDLTAVLVAARQDKAREDLECGRCTWAWALAARHGTTDSYRSLTRLAHAQVRRGQWPAAARLLHGAIAMQGCRPAQAVLETAVGALRRRFPDGAALDDLVQTLSTLERAYG